MVDMADVRQRLEWGNLLESGRDFTVVTQREAQKRAKALVKEGRLAQERVQTYVEDLISSSRGRAQAFADAVQKEVERQIKSLGVATRGELRRLEKRIGRAGPAKKQATKKATKKSAKKKATKKSAKKRAAKKSAKKSTAKKRPAKKAAKRTVKKAAGAASS